MGKPVVAGTRVTVESILERLAAGESETQILEANPRLTPADIRAALQCAAEVLHGDRIYPHEIAALDPAVNLVADENVDAGIVSALRDAGRAVTYVRELDPGIDDERVLRLAEFQGALLLTSDKDFGELVFRQHLLHSGVIFSVHPCIFDKPVLSEVEGVRANGKSLT